MPIDYTKTREVFSGGMIPRWGQLAVLRRVGAPDRPVRVVIANFTPQERVGQLANPTDRKALLSTIAPDGSIVAEPTERDRLITFKINPATGQPVSPQQDDENLAIVAPAARVGNGPVTIFWRLQVRR